VDCL